MLQYVFVMVFLFGCNTRKTIDESAKPQPSRDINLSQLSLSSSFVGEKLSTIESHELSGIVKTIPEFSSREGSSPVCKKGQGLFIADVEGKVNDSHYDISDCVRSKLKVGGDFVVDSAQVTRQQWRNCLQDDLQNGTCEVSEWQWLDVMRYDFVVKASSSGEVSELRKLSTTSNPSGRPCLIKQKSANEFQFDRDCQTSITWVIKNARRSRSFLATLRYNDLSFLQIKDGRSYLNGQIEFSLNEWSGSLDMSTRKWTVKKGDIISNGQI